MGTVLIDCGCNDGTVLRRWAKNVPADRLIAFEPNVNVMPKVPNGTAVYRCAVWDTDTLIPWYQCNDATYASTAIETKAASDGESHQKLYVKAIDFSRFLRMTFINGEVLHVKMDIEGAEYRVLRHLLSAGTIGLINTLYIEWHWKKCGVSALVHDSLIHELSNVPGLTVKPELARLLKKGLPL